MWRLTLLRLTVGILVPTAVFACGGSEAQVDVVEAAPPGMVRLSEAQMRAAGIATSLVGTDTIRASIRVPGTVQSPDTAQATVGSIVEGRVVAVRVLPGTEVRRGQPLVEIHSHELASAQADLTSAEARLTFHENALDRSRQLLDAGAVSLEEVERRKADYQAAEAELVRAEEMVEHLYPSPSGNVRALAPKNGTVFAVHARPGQAVLPGTPLVEMGTTDVLWVTAFVPEHSASTLSVGDVVHVGFRSPPDDAVTARLVQSGNFVDPANRSVEMRFELDRIPAGVRPGTFAFVDIVSSEALQGVELTESAAVRMDEENVVFVLEEPGLFRKVIVDAIPLTEGRVAIQGLPPAVEVVTEGAYFLKAAMETAGLDESGGSSDP